MMTLFQLKNMVSHLMEYDKPDGGKQYGYHKGFLQCLLGLVLLANLVIIEASENLSQSSCRNEGRVRSTKIYDCDIYA
jgi:hypothetical protein